MSRISSRIQKLKGKSKSKEELLRTIVLTMREMHWSWAEFLEVPVPVFYLVVDILNKDAKKQEQEMNKRRRR